MFSRKKNLLFVFRKEGFVPLHMFFVFYPILVFFIDKDHKLVESAYLRPWQIYSPKHKSKYILEVSTLPPKLLMKFKEIKLGIKITWD